jgi:uncharacterized protein (DUF58 family)
VNDIFKKIRLIEIKSRKPVDQLFAGEYRSVFKGQGLEFHEVREYQPGDDIRQIDWNVTARLGHPYIKKFVEERQRTIILMVDVSASLDFGSLAKTKTEIAAELAAILAFSAIKNNDLVGLLLFSDITEKYIPPKKGKKHVMRLIREILYFKRQNKKTDLPQAIKYLNRVHRKNAIVFLLSDFLGVGAEKPMAALAKRHDLIPIVIKDRYEKELPSEPVILSFEDPESGERNYIDLSDRKVRSAYAKKAAEQDELRRKHLRAIDSDFIELSTDGEYIKPLNLFFRRREKRIRH